MRTPSFRARIILVSAGAVAIAVVLAAVVVFLVVRGELRGQIDNRIRDQARHVAQLPILSTVAPGEALLHVPPPPFGDRGALQVVTESGQAFRDEHSASLPVSRPTLDVAAGRAQPFFSTASVRGIDVRIFTAPIRPGLAVQVATPLTETEHELARIRLWLFAIAIAGVGLACALGGIVARAALAPVRRLTETAEHVAETRDLSSRIEVSGEDELARLGSTFNAMLEALDEAARAQRQFISDASHELRTPLTSLRTNIEVLLREGDPLDPAKRRELLRDIAEQMTEMTTLVTELIELARGDAQAPPSEEVRFDLLIEDVIERVQRNWPSVGIGSDLDEMRLFGARTALERLVGNLLDNAMKWSPAGSNVAVRLRDGELTVRDHGPGIDERDMPFVFDRFYRSATARGQVGSGLGLAIVKQVVETHGGTVVAERAEGGGTLIRVRLPTIGVERGRQRERVQRLTFPVSAKDSRRER
jgi:two-component system sensor histidine kinase MprB